MARFPCHPSGWTQWCHARAESFVVCQDYTPPAGFKAEHLRAVLEHGCADASAADVSPLIPFVACGDLSGWDADRSYDLPAEGYVRLDPVQPPTAPAYKSAIQRAKAQPSGQ